MARKAISARKRFEVFKRDGFSCQYCGANPPAAILHVDHIVAVSNGGQNDTDNLVTSCDRCNFGKGAVPLSSVPKSLSEKAREVAEREKQIKGYNAILESRRQRIEDESWMVVNEIEGKAIDSYDKRNLSSVRIFLERLPLQEVLEAARIANAKFCHSTHTRFRYFCGICWRKINEGGN